jgi:hypothetical protein
LWAAEDRDCPAIAGWCPDYPPRAAIAGAPVDVSNVPNPEVPTSLDGLVGAAHQRKRHRQTQRSGGLEIDDQLNSGRLVDWQVNGFGALTGALEQRGRT